MRVLFEVVSVVVHVPMEPPLTLMPLVQLAALVCVGFGVVVVGTGV